MTNVQTLIEDRESNDVFYWLAIESIPHIYATNPIAEGHSHTSGSWAYASRTVLTASVSGTLQLDFSYNMEIDAREGRLRDNTVNFKIYDRDNNLNQIFLSEGKNIFPSTETLTPGTDATQSELFDKWVGNEKIGINGERARNSPVLGHNIGGFKGSVNRDFQGEYVPVSDTPVITEGLRCALYKCVRDKNVFQESFEGVGAWTTPANSYRVWWGTLTGKLTMKNKVLTISANGPSSWLDKRLNTEQDEDPRLVIGPIANDGDLALKTSDRKVAITLGYISYIQNTDGDYIPYMNLNFPNYKFNKTLTGITSDQLRSQLRTLVETIMGSSLPGGVTWPASKNGIVTQTVGLGGLLKLLNDGSFKITINNPTSSDSATMAFATITLSKKMWAIFGYDVAFQKELPTEEDTFGNFKKVRHIQTGNQFYETVPTPHNNYWQLSIATVPDNEIMPSQIYKFVGTDVPTELDDLPSTPTYVRPIWKNNDGTADVLVGDPGAKGQQVWLAPSDKHQQLSHINPGQNTFSPRPVDRTFVVGTRFSLPSLYTIPNVGKVNTMGLYLLKGKRIRRQLGSVRKKSVYRFDPDAGKGKQGGLPRNVEVEITRESKETTYDETQVALCSWRRSTSGLIVDKMETDDDFNGYPTMLIMKYLDPKQFGLDEKILRSDWQYGRGFDKDGELFGVKAYPITAWGFGNHKTCANMIQSILRSSGTGGTWLGVYPRGTQSGGENEAGVGPLRIGIRSVVKLYDTERHDMGLNIPNEMIAHPRLFDAVFRRVPSRMRGGRYYTSGPVVASDLISEMIRSKGIMLTLAGGKYGIDNIFRKANPLDSVATITEDDLDLDDPKDFPEVEKRSFFGKLDEVIIESSQHPLNGNYRQKRTIKNYSLQSKERTAKSTYEIKDRGLHKAKLADLNNFWSQAMTNTDKRLYTFDLPVHTSVGETLWPGDIVELTSVRIPNPKTQNYGVVKYPLRIMGKSVTVSERRKSVVLHVSMFDKRENDHDRLTGPTGLVANNGYITDNGVHKLYLAGPGFEDKNSADYGRLGLGTLSTLRGPGLGLGAGSRDSDAGCFGRPLFLGSSVGRPSLKLSSSDGQGNRIKIIRELVGSGSDAKGTFLQLASGPPSNYRSRSRNFVSLNIASGQSSWVTASHAPIANEEGRVEGVEQDGILWTATGLKLGS